MMAAGLALQDIGIEALFIKECTQTFPGIEHRLEFFYENGGVRFYNDSAATVPQAVLAAVSAFDSPVILVTGGADKNLDFTPLVKAAQKAKTVLVLKGTGTDKLTLLLKEKNIAYKGPYTLLEEAVEAVFLEAAAGDVALLSPGCASFGMFQNEFERGKIWKELVKKYKG